MSQTYEHTIARPAGHWHARLQRRMAAAAARLRAHGSKVGDRERALWRSIAEAACTNPALSAYLRSECPEVYSDYAAVRAIPGPMGHALPACQTANHAHMQP